MISLKTKATIYKVLAIVLGPLLCLLTLEILCGILVYKGIHIEDVVHVQPHTTTVPRDTRTYSQEIPHSPPAQIYKPTPVKKLDSPSPFPLSHLDSTKSFILPLFNQRGTISRKRDSSPEPIYTIDMNTDEVGRRMFELPEPKAPWTHHIAVMGCSYTLGEAIQSHESIGAQLHHLLPSYKPYNLGFSGYGVSDVLARTLAHNFMKDIEPKSGIGLYFFIEDHIKRSLGFMSNLGFWGQGKPVLIETTPYHYKYPGTYAKLYPLYVRWIKFLWSRNIVQFFRLNWPLHISAENYDQIARMLKGLELEYKKRTLADNPFIVVIYPDVYLDMDFPLFKQALERHKILFIDYGQVEITYRIPRLARVHYDDHPTGAANEHMAQLLAQDLKVYFK